MSTDKTNTIFDRILSGETVSFNDPDYDQLHLQSERAISILVDLNTSRTLDDIRRYLGELLSLIHI